MSTTYGDLTVDWLGYATSRITDGERVVYLDPGRYGVLDAFDARDGVPASETSGARRR